MLAASETVLRADPGNLLGELLGPARDPDVPSRVRRAAYRLLLDVLEANLGDHSFAATVHREWMALSVHAPSRAIRRSWISRSARR
jgi:hypothetical protein